MSEPTPLSDCETQVYYGYSCGIVAEQAATIDAQATEIAALKGALTGIVSAIDAHHPKYRHGPFTLTRTEVEAARRVLAGKGQCPKCEGRGFIRTMVDGQRDSEPCSYCRMSGLAGKEAQGGD